MLADLRLALHRLRAAPGFALAALLTLTLGVGVTVAAVSAADAVLLRPLPYADPARVHYVWEQDRADDPPPYQTSLRNAVDWRARTRAYARLGAFRYWIFNLAGGPQAEALLGAYVTDDAFAVLGVPAARGRTFLPGEDRPGGPAVAVISDALWRRRFGADPGAVGRTLRVDGVPRTVVGVMPPGFDFPPLIPATVMVPSRALEVWVPAGVDPLAEGRGNHNWWILGRLAPGVGEAAARDELARFGRAQHAAHPEASAFVRGRPIGEVVAAPVRPALVLLGAAAGVVLLVACANVAGLLLARGLGRGREVAVRRALGATRGRVARQLGAEAAVLAAGAGALGAGLAAAGLRTLVRLAPESVPRAAEVHLSAVAVGGAVAAAALTAVATGLWPSLLSAGGREGGGRDALAPALRAGGRTATAGAAAGRARSALVVAQVALSLVLLAGAGLLLRSYRALQQAQLGFRPEGVLTMYAMLPGARYPDARAQAAFFTRAVENAARLPAVEAASAVNVIPLSGLGSNSTVAVEGKPIPAPADRLGVDDRAVTPDHFRTLGIPVVAGRGFAPADTLGAPRVAVVSAELARRLFPGEDPVGRRLVQMRDDPLTIVGVAGDIRDRALDQPPAPAVYLPVAQEGAVIAGVLVRTRGDPRAAEGAVRRALAAVDPDQPVMGVRPMTDYLVQGTEARRFGLALTGTFAAAALALSAVGLYGVLAYLVGLRAREIAVRAALGATRAQVVRLVAAGALRLTAAGVVLGVVGALALRRVVAAQLYGVGPGDPATLAAVAATLVAVALLAAWVPARRAARVDPAAALRAD